MNSPRRSVKPPPGRESTFLMVKRCLEMGLMLIPTRPKAAPHLNAGSREDRPSCVPLAEFASAWKSSPKQMEAMLSDNGIGVFTCEGEVFVIEPLTSAKLLEAVHKPLGAPHHD